jgi:membrane-bound lytic murein transglycosylase B
MDAKACLCQKQRMDRRAFFRPFLAGALLTAARPVLASNDEFAAHKDRLMTAALNQGIDRATLRRELGGVSYDTSVIRLDNKQPEHTITFAQYESNAFKTDRVSAGTQKLREHCGALGQVSEKFGVAPEYLVALWGSETNYGRFKGNSDVLQSLINLSFAGRPGKFIDRRQMFADNAIAALQIIAQGRYSRASLRGSYAGAFGHHQFMPQSFLSAAIDGDGDGRADIINSVADSFASAANLLVQKGWRKDAPWGRAVACPRALLEQPMGVEVKKPLAAWRELGVTLKDGQPLPEADAAEQEASLVLPDRAVPSEAYLFYNNAHTLWRWNNSSWFVVVTEKTARRIAQAASCR